MLAMACHHTSAADLTNFPTGPQAGQVNGTPIASISLGSSRVFAFTPDAYGERWPPWEPQCGLWLMHRTLLVMKAECNLPKNMGGCAHALLSGPDGLRENQSVRFNLTFRVMQSKTRDGQYYECNA